MRKKYVRALGLLLFVVVLLGGLVAARKYYMYRQERTSVYAMEQIVEALATKDQAIFEEFVDVDAVLLSMHENAAGLFSEHMGALHERYPDDWFFRHDVAFMQGYMAERRTRDIDAARRMIAFYFDEDRLPVTRADGAARWGADEMRAFAEHYTVQAKTYMKDGAAEGAAVTYTVTVTGDDSTYGQLLPTGDFYLLLRRQEDGRFRLVGVMVREDAYAHGFYPLVDAAERYWALQGWD